MKLIERFLLYVSIDTQSNPDSKCQPSTNKQFTLLDRLVKEMKSIGIEDASLDRNGYVMGTIPSNISGKAPVIGFISHVDTSPDASGSKIHPQIIENYDGGDIMLNTLKGIVLKASDFPEVAAYKGQTIITSDGTTLLGADDKAGVAEIITAADHLISHPEIKHGTVKIAFTPDEEIGRGVDCFDVKKFGADFAFTVDGGEIGELEYENFNAAEARIHIQGRNIHPGYAKGKMKNALLIASELNSMLPAEETPAHTEGYEGFFHLTKLTGTVDEADMQYIIRDHDKKKFSTRKNLLEGTVATLNKKYGNILKLDLNDQYYNMKEQLEGKMEIIEIARRAMLDAGVTPKIKPIRGGTDGASLSYMGLPCPNIFTGGHNFHGRYEYIPLQSMEKAVEVIVNIARLSCESPEK